MALSVGPIPADPRPDNDRRTLTVTVTDDRARVFLLAGEPSWEFQYLRNALVRDPRVDLTAAAIRQPPAGPAAKPTYETGLPPEDPNAPGSGSTPDPLGAFDLIILIDPAPGDLDDAAWARLDRFVAGRGGALVLVCGSRGGVGLGAGEAAARLLPVRDVRPREPGPDAAPDPDRPALPPGLRIVPDPSALDGPWPMLLLGDDPEASRETWRALPPQPRVWVGAAKPSAVVLARAASMADEGDAGPDDDSAMIAAMPYGLGKVLWLGTNATWRWRFRAGDRIHHRFWGQVIPWAADAPLAVGNRLLAFGAVPPRVAEDVRPIIRARLSDAAATGPAASMLVAAKIRRADQPPDAADPVALVPLRPRDDQSRVFEAEAPALPPGSYRITLEWPALDAALRAEGPPLEAPLEVTTRPTSERIELAAARDPLERLAAATGGAVLTPDRVDEIPDLLARRATVRTRTESARLWDRPEALLLFLGLMTIEWITRKRAGLP
jgi:hypothetical protein